MTRTMNAAPAGATFLLRPRRKRQRWALAAAAAVAAAAHAPVIAPHLDEAPYMGALFILLTAACVVLAASALIRDSTAVYVLAVLTCGLAIIGYIATRLVPFPMLADDVGNWLEPLGVVSVLSEAVVVTAAVTALTNRVHPPYRRSGGTCRQVGEDRPKKRQELFCQAAHMLRIRESVLSPLLK